VVRSRATSAPEQISLPRAGADGGLAFRRTLSPEPISQNTIAPEFGADNLRAGRAAGIWALGAVSVFMVFYYFVFGRGRDVISLLSNAMLILGAMSAGAGGVHAPRASRASS
jgi:hypothetical protein